MSPKAIAVAGLSAIAIAGSGCGGDSDEVKFRAAFKKSFGEATWYHHITGMKMSSENSTWLEITKDLDPESETNGEPGRTICGAAMHFALDHEVGDGIEAVRMMDSDRVEMGGCA